MSQAEEHSPVLDEDLLEQPAFRGPWRPLLLLLVTAVLVAGGIFAYRLRTQGAVTTTYTTAPVTRGDLAVGVSATGPVSTAASIPLTFKNSGLLTNVLVKPGDTVTAGQVLAQEDPTDLQHALAQARAQLAQQQAALQKLETGPTPQALAVAQQSIATAQSNLANAQKSLDLVAQQNAKDLQQAQVALHNAQASAGSVQNEAAKSEAADQTALGNAQQNLASMQAQIAANTAADRVSVQNALQALTNAQQNLTPVQQQITAALQTDTTAVQNAQQSLQHAQAVAAAGTPVQQQQLAQVKNALNTAQIQRDAACNLADSRNSQAGCNAANAAVNTQQTAIDTATAQIAQSQAQAQQTVAQAQAALKSAQDAAAADKVKQQATSLSAQQAVTQASDGLKSAQAALSNNQAKFSGSVVSAQGALKAAQAALASDQARNQAQGQAAAAGVQTAQAALNDQTGKAAQALQQAQAAVDADSQAVRTAQNSYNQLKEPPTAADLAGAQAAVQNAKAAVATAQGNLDDATLRAPIAATVAQVNDIAGQFVSGGAVGTSASASSNASTTAFLVFTDLNKLQVTAQVNEADMAKVALGQPVQFTLNAFPGQNFTGKVAEIQPLGSSSNNVVSYNVTCSIDPTKTRLLPGMTANVTIVTQSRSNVLAVPAAALSFAQSAAANQIAAPVAPQGANSASLLVLQNRKAVRLPVQTGLSDGNRTEIVSGLQSGEQVVTGTGG
jgi:HlyD family secretion protein